MWTTAVSGCSAGTEASSAASRLAVGRIAGGEPDGGAQLVQFLRQLGCPVGAFAASRDQQQVPHAALGHQVAGQQAAQRPVAPVSRTVPAGFQSARSCLGAGRSWSVRGASSFPSRMASWGSSRAQAAISARAESGCSSRSTSTNLSGVLALCRADQAPERRRREVAHLLPRAGCHRAPGEQHQPCLGGALLGEPVLNQLQGMAGRLVRRSGDVAVRGGKRRAQGQHGPGHRRPGRYRRRQSSRVIVATGVNAAVGEES